MTTATKTKRPKTTEQRRTASVTTNGDGVYTLMMCVGPEHKRECHGYYLTPFAAQFGRGFHMEKFESQQSDGEENEYDVLIDTDDGLHQCHCLGFLRWNHCKHVESLAALIAAGKL